MLDTCLELLLLDVGPKPIDDLGSAELFPLLAAHDGCQFTADVERLGQS